MKKDHVVLVQDHEERDLICATKVFGPLTKTGARNLADHLYKKHEGSATLVHAFKLKEA